MSNRKLKQRIAESAFVIGAASLFIIVCVCLYVAVQWSIFIFPVDPITVILAWTGTLFVLSIIVLLVLIWTSREEEQEKEEETPYARFQELDDFRSFE